MLQAKSQRDDPEEMGGKKANSSAPVAYCCVDLVSSSVVGVIWKTTQSQVTFAVVAASVTLSNKRHVKIHVHQAELITSRTGSHTVICFFFFFFYCIIKSIMTAWF